MGLWIPNIWNPRVRQFFRQLRFTLLWRMNSCVLMQTKHMITMTTCTTNDHNDSMRILFAGNGRQNVEYLTLWQQWWLRLMEEILHHLGLTQIPMFSWKAEPSNRVLVRNTPHQTSPPSVIAAWIASAAAAAAATAAAATTTTQLPDVCAASLVKHLHCP